MQTKFGNLFDATELNELRKKFKYVDAQANGKKRVFFDNAGGSLRLIDAEERFHAIDLHPDASEHLNTLALELLDIENKGREDIRTLFNAKHGAIATGYTASQLMMEAVRIVSENVKGTNVVTTCLEHPSSFDAMSMYAEKYGRELRVAKANPITGGIDTEEVISLIDKDTAIVSVMAASNISGHIMDIAAIAKQAKAINPDIIVISDAVQHAPHGTIDPENDGIDVMNFAPYKFFGIRGFALMYISDRVKDWPHHRLLGSPSDNWEIGSPGTANFAAMSAIVDYVCGLGTKAAAQAFDRRQLFEAGMKRIADHERALLELMLEGTETAPGLRHIPGINVKMDDPDLNKRDLIIGIEFANMDAVKAREELEKRGVVAFERMGNSIYSARMLEQFNSPGVVRMSPLHVNTPEEITFFLNVCAEVAAL
ncbi:aminotransferase class V-fold PLP-dependent enzyme [uncultured Phascolarctobacterium sp.]|jgi:cysteine desulfurase/selenocysteine lyase|uniref:aminotransferase class V-fold PLP-dependent enzyme n=1 Tax=uncultured Phascolarctobacterium sp. TaxID=512296 RepID=UPI0025D19B52|nr:aminotransferase class V-fold PLP-dependent enzyme [uncultured Phascolarctobacterium sp.]